MLRARRGRVALPDRAVPLEQVRERCSQWGAVTTYYDMPQAEAQHDCESMNGLFCMHHAGISQAVANVCVEACAASMPDFSSAPECADRAEDCPFQCVQALTVNTMECARCITATIDWSGNECGTTECFCPGASFAYCPEACRQP